MKKHTVLLAIAATLAATSSSWAGDNAQSDKSTKAARTTATKHVAAASHQNRETFYITDHVVTGSNIPVVVTRYRNHNTTSSPTVSYDQSDISSTGALSVGSALVRLDPAISFAHR